MAGKLKRLAALLTAAVMAVAVLPVSAEQADSSDNWKNLSGGG